jgi:hypothetical protein
LQHCRQDPALTAAYFYFDFKNTEKCRPQNLVRSLITQFSARRMNLPEALAQLFSQCQNGKQQPTMASLMMTLKQMIGDSHTFIILDALDECAEREDLLGLMEEIQDWKLMNLHILVTSRREREIENSLRSRGSCEINIQSRVVDDDILLHIQERLEHDPKLKDWPVEVQEEIKITLMSGAHGMYSVFCLYPVESELMWCCKVSMGCLPT